MTYLSQSARDAEASDYGDASYWDYLDQSAQETRDYFLHRGELELAANQMTRSLSDALRGNEGD